jgi:hypothetical protein
MNNIIKRLLDIIVPFVIWYALWNIFDHLFIKDLPKDKEFLLINGALLSVSLVLIFVVDIK